MYEKPEFYVIGNASELIQGIAVGDPDFDSQPTLGSLAATKLEEM